MSDLSIDRLARLLSRPAGRRLTLGLAAASLGALVGRSEPAAAKCVRPNKRCRKSGETLKCCGGAKCRGKTCRCIGGRIPCNGRCISAACCTNADCSPGQLCDHQQGNCVVPALERVEVGDVAVGQTVQGTVSLDHPAMTDTTITLVVANGNATVPSSVIVTTGQTIGTFDVGGITPGPERITATLNEDIETDDFMVVT